MYVVLYFLRPELQLLMLAQGGVFGSLMGTPIINVPQTAVLGLHAIKDKPVAVNGKIEIRPVCYFDSFLGLFRWIVLTLAIR